VSRYQSLFWLLLAACCSSPVNSASLTLKDQLWEMLIIPANAEGSTIGTLFGDDLPSGEYGDTWAIFTYDNAMNGYQSPGVNDSLSVGQAFWMIQATGGDVVIDIPDSLPTVATPETNACAPGTSCVRIPLSSGIGDVTWTMAGVPFPGSTSVSDFRFVTGAGGLPCSSGCEMGQATSAGYTGGPVWVYDSTLGNYRDAVVVGNVNTWQGFWFSTLPIADGTSPALSLPGPSNECSLYVANNGSDSNSGRSSGAALRNVQTAIGRSSAGDTVCLARGTYPAPILVANKQGSAAQPITLQPMPGDEGEVDVRDGSASLRTGVEVRNSSHINIVGLDIQQVLRGIQYNSVTGGSVVGNVVANIQQEGIRAGALVGSQGLVGGPSTNIRIASNTIRDTGNRTGQSSQGNEYNEFGEGIYIGTGKYRNDATHDIVVESNTITDITAEGIEVKPYTYNVTVRSNTISNNRLKYSGAITVAVGPNTTRNGNYLIEDNVIFDVQSRRYTIAGIVIGQGNATVRNNTIWDIDGGRGIRVYTTFVLSSANDVRLEGNTVWNPGSSRSLAIHDGTGGFGLNRRADVTLVGNITDDGSGQSQRVNASAFVGPITGTANRGSGPGSGFTLR